MKPHDFKRVGLFWIGLLASLMACDKETRPGPSHADPGATSDILSVKPVGGSPPGPPVVVGASYWPAAAAVFVVEGSVVTLDDSPEPYTALLATEPPRVVSPLEAASIVDRIPSALMTSGEQPRAAAALFLPSDSAAMDVLFLSVGGALPYRVDAVSVVGWEATHRSSRAARHHAVVWASRSTETGGSLLSGEFLLHAGGSSPVTVVSTDALHVCEASAQGLSNCRESSSALGSTRVGLCGFSTWGQAIAALSHGFPSTPVTEMVLFGDCPDFDDL